MKKFIFMFTFLFPYTILGNAATSWDAKRVYKDLTTANHFQNAPKLVVDNSLIENAYFTGPTIVINKGLLQFAKNNDEVALILGHELGHWYNHDGYKSESHKIEYAADQLGAVYASKAGYNYCLGRYIHLRFGDKSSASHPSSINRFNRFKCK